MSTPGSEGPDFWTAVMAVLTGIGGGLLALWRAATMVGSLKTEINSMKDDIEKIDTKVDVRHEANQGLWRDMVARMATKDDLRSLEQVIRSLFNGHR